MGPTGSRNWLSRTIFDDPGRADMLRVDRWSAFERGLSRFVGYTAMLFTLAVGAYLLLR